MVLNEVPQFDQLMGSLARSLGIEGSLSRGSSLHLIRFAGRPRPLLLLSKNYHIQIVSGVFPFNQGLVPNVTRWPLSLEPIGSCLLL